MVITFLCLIIFSFFLDISGAALNGGIYSITTGTCATAGYEVITTVAECNQAAAALGWDDTTAVTGAWSRPPFGCCDGSALMLNTAGEYGDVACSSTYKCACKIPSLATLYPLCEKKDGRTQNPAADCSCNEGETCNDANGRYCLALPSTQGSCHIHPVAWSYYIENDESTCGNNIITNTEMCQYFSEQGLPWANNKIEYDIKDRGYSGQPDGCQNSEDWAWEINFHDNSNPNPNPNPNCRPAFQCICHNSSNPITVLCEKNDGITQNSVADCSCNGGDTCNDDNGRYCNALFKCTEHPLCSETDGITQNSVDDCSCIGGDTCNDANGRYCNAGKCTSDVKCLTDGITQNPVDCSCNGGETCNDDNGRYCLALPSAPGFCRSRPSTWSYYIKENITCGDHLIDNLEMCQYLSEQSNPGLEPSAPPGWEGSWGNQPVGCQNSLYGWEFNSDIGNVECSTFFRCICQDSSNPTINLCEKTDGNDPNDADCSCNEGETCNDANGRYCLALPSTPGFCRSYPATWSYYMKKTGKCGNDIIDNIEMCQYFSEQGLPGMYLEENVDPKLKNDEISWKTDGCENSEYGWVYNWPVRSNIHDECSTFFRCICQDSLNRIVPKYCLDQSGINDKLCTCGTRHPSFGQTCQEDEYCVGASAKCLAEDSRLQTVEITENTCLHPLNEEECNQFEPLKDITTRTVLLPYGCTNSESGYTMNNYVSGHDCGTTDNGLTYNCICHETETPSFIPICNDNDTENTRFCACGTKMKTCESGEYCYAGKCTDDPLCSETDGITQNTADCSCNEGETCNDANGRYCLALPSTPGFCREYPSTWSYYIKEEGTCGDHLIDNLKMCQYLSEQSIVGLEPSAPPGYVGSWGNQPIGCQNSPDFGWEINEIGYVNCDTTYRCICQDSSNPVVRNYCPDQSGKNSELCTCGTRHPDAPICQEDEYCYGTHSQCKTFGSGMPAFKEVKGKCDTGGLSLNECQRIAESVAGREREDIEVSYTDIPHGCWHASIEQYFIPSHGFIYNGKWSSEQPECGETITINDDSFVPTCLCYETNPPTIHPPCNDPSMKNDEKCVCGTTFCNANEYCLVGFRRRLYMDLMINTFGTEDQCSSTGRFNFIVEDNSNECNADRGLAMITDKSMCGNSRRMPDEKAADDLPAGCRYVNAGTGAVGSSLAYQRLDVYWNPLTTEELNPPMLFEYGDAPSFCKADDFAPCPTDGFLTENCVCGTTDFCEPISSSIMCLEGEDPGARCQPCKYKDENGKCRPTNTKCKHTNGLFPNEFDCQCGDEDCASSTEIEWTYSVRPEPCSEYGEIMIEEADCSQYATGSDFQRLSVGSVPYGCFKSKNDDSRINYNDMPSSIPCSVEHLCICKKLKSAAGTCANEKEFTEEECFKETLWKYGKQMKRILKNNLPYGCLLKKGADGYYPVWNEFDLQQPDRCTNDNCWKICKHEGMNPQILGNYCIEEDSTCIPNDFLHRRADSGRYGLTCAINEELQMKCHCGLNFCKPGQFCLPEGTCANTGSCDLRYPGRTHSQCTCGDNEQCSSLYYESIVPCPPSDQISGREECARAHDYLKSKTDDFGAFVSKDIATLPYGCIGQLVVPYAWAGYKNYFWQYEIVWNEDASASECNNSWQCNSHICKRDSATTNPICTLENNIGTCQPTLPCENDNGAEYNPNTKWPFLNNQCMCGKEVCTSGLRLKREECEIIPKTAELCEAAILSQGLQFNGVVEFGTGLPSGCMHWYGGHDSWNPYDTDHECPDNWLCSGMICADYCSPSLSLVKTSMECGTKASEYGYTFGQIDDENRPRECFIDTHLNSMVWNSETTDVGCVDNECLRHHCSTPEETPYCDTTVNSNGICSNVKFRERKCENNLGINYNNDLCQCGTDVCEPAHVFSDDICATKPESAEDCKAVTEMASIVFLEAEEYFNNSLSGWPSGCLLIIANEMTFGVWNRETTNVTCADAPTCIGHLCMDGCEPIPQTDAEKCEEFANIKGIAFRTAISSSEVPPGCFFRRYYKLLDNSVQATMFWNELDTSTSTCISEPGWLGCHRKWCPSPTKRGYCNADLNVCSVNKNPSCSLSDQFIQIEPGEECKDGYVNIETPLECANFAQQTELVTVEYSLLQTGTCETNITDHEECMLAAVDLKKSKDFTTATIANNDELPPGCLFYKDWGTERAPQFNNLGEQNCGANGYHCICKTLTVNIDETYTYGNRFWYHSYNAGCILIDKKAYFNGAIDFARNDAHKTRRLCILKPGLEGCQCSHDEVCNVEARFCDSGSCTNERACQNKDGNTPNGKIDCLCGQVMCTNTTGFFCLAEESRCAKGPSCANTNGQEPNEQCGCGDRGCESGEYCYIPEDNSPCDHNSSIPTNFSFCYDPTALSQTKAVCSTERNRVGEIDICSFNYVEKNNNKCYCGGNICSADEPYCLHGESLCSAEPNRPPCQENQPLDECECGATDAEYCPINGKALCGSDEKCKFPSICLYIEGQLANSFCRCAPDTRDPTSEPLSSAYNPCPASHPFLEKWENGNLYWCYREAGNVGPCRMSTSGRAAPLGGSWGTGQSDCDLRTKLAVDAGKGAPLFEHCVPQKSPYCNPSANGQLRCTANPMCDTYKIKTSGRCTDEPGWDYITTSGTPTDLEKELLTAECQTAKEMLYPSSSGLVQNAYDNESYPTGCLLSNDGHFYVNIGTGPTVCGTDGQVCLCKNVNQTESSCSCEINGEFVSCVDGQYCDPHAGKCMSAPPCKNTNGLTTQEECACFDQICTAGQYCHGDTCKDYQMCDDMTGENPVSECGCGTLKSNVHCFAGQYCHGNSCENEQICSVDGNNDTCVCSSQAKKTIIQTTTYWQGCLPSPAGQARPTFKGPVYEDLTKDECEGIASIYDYPFVEIPQGDTLAASKPRFCSTVDSIVYYNQNYPNDWFSNNNERCNTGNETCLCKTANPEQKVICSKEESCVRELNQCSISDKFGEELADIAWPDNPNMYGTCTNDDIILNGQTCLCGSTFCKKGEKCSGYDGANPTCEYPPACHEGMNAEGCRCNDLETCVSGTGLYCHNTDTRDQNFCSRDLCNQTDGRWTNTPECACGIADCQPGQYCNSTKSECSSVDMCSPSEDVIDAECRCGSSQETCSIDQYCYTGLEKCVSEPPCDHQNGLQTNTAACYCKTALCNDGQFCSGDLAECSSDGIFSGSPVCQIQDKTAENEVHNCWCGSNKCSRDDSTGMVCDYSASECSHVTCNTQASWISDTCRCGDNVCVASTGFQCSSVNECEFAHNCTYLYGEGKNEANCRCRNIECNRKEPYCHREYGCSATPKWRNPPVSGPLISACVYIDEEQPNMNKCLCGTSICDDKNLCKASENKCTPIPDCTYQQPLLLNDGKSCTCDSDGLFCHKGSAICDPTAGICDPLDQCEFSNNNTENSRACTCGSNTCTQSTGLICDGSSCYKHEPCLNELPFKLNERACQCGETPCVNYPHCSNLCQGGSYCSKKFEHCSAGPGFRGYLQKVDGDCPALDTESILNQTMNETAAEIILSVYGNKSFVSFGNECSNCSGGELPAPGRVPPIQVKNDNDNDWCAYAPNCTRTDGINSNDGSCACTVAQGGIFYCQEYQKYCSTGCHENPKCPFTSGISQNEPCACGQYLRHCDDENPFCIEDLNGGTCFNSTICSETDGLMKTSEDCFCGENKVHCSAGLYCIASESGGTCLPEGPCQNMYGSEQNSEKCRCGSVDNMCGPGQYCFHDDENNICDDNPIQICDSKEGFIISTEACWCGSEDRCDANNYCHKDAGVTCRDSPRCLYSEGKLQNIEECDCSGVKTTTDKLYCYSDQKRVSQYPNEVFSDDTYIQKCDLSGQKAPESKKCLCGISKECGDEYCIGGIPFDGDNIGYLYSCEQFKNELGPYAGENTVKLVIFCQQGYIDKECTYGDPQSNNACEWGKKLKEHHENDVKCDDKPACGDYTRSETNPGECWCGTNECTADIKGKPGTGLTCSALNGGTCGHPMCSDNLALENIGFKCSCSPNKSSFKSDCEPNFGGARKLCYYPDDDTKCNTVSEPETGDYLECGCTDKKLYECTYFDGLKRNLDTSDICACGETVCKPGQYCNAEFSMCGDTTIQSCDHQDGLRVNPTSCLCGPEPCGSGGFYCNPKRECEGTESCFCHKKLCSDFQDPDSLCDFEGYGAGLVPDAQCAGTTCTPDDLKICCRVCGGDFRVIDGVCTRECTRTIRVDGANINLCQSGSFFPTVIDWNATQIKKDASYIAFLSRMSPLYSGYCSSTTCSADDQDLCCLPAQQCKTQDPYNLCVGGTYTGEFTDPDAYCTGIDCEARDCCAKLSCTCENGSPAVGRQCPQVGTPKCIACNTEYWLNGFQCVAATTCDPTEWESIPLGTRNDRRCVDLRICRDTQYETVAPDQTTNRECEYLTVCNETQYISKEKETDTNGNAISNRECEDIIECKENEYETKSPTKTSDDQYKENRECETMAGPCDQNHYESQSPTVNRNRICSPYNITCSENEFELSSRTETSDRQCQTLADCDLETQFIAQERQANSDRICQDLTKCQSYEYEFEEKTETTDRTCRTISNCSSGFFIATNYTNTSDRACQAWKTCTTNEYVFKEPTETTDRECETCVPFDNLATYNPTCLGCRFETDCTFNPESLVSDRTKCSGITCKRHILDANHADIIVKVDTWIRFESKPDETYTFESSGAIANEIINTDLNYRYFQVVSSDGFIKINGTELKIQQDCTFGEYIWQGCSVRCGTGQELGFRGQKLMDAKHGGATCGATPKTTTRSCAGQFCPQNCQIEWNTESDKTTPKFGPCNTTCGEEGLQYRNYSIIKEPENGGLECPTKMQQRGCVGTDPGYCDCKKNVLDQCEVCGGNGDTCLGCDNVPNSGYEWNACGECMPEGAPCSPQAHSKLTKLTQKQEKSKKTKTMITKTFVPIIAGILLFVSSVIGLAVYISKRDKKTTGRGVREIFLA